MPVNIHGKEYLTVAERVHEFRKAHPDWTLTTEILSINPDEVVTKASIMDVEGRVIATGLSQEFKASSRINSTSMVENSETSAIGRALAFFGMAGTEIASADEVKEAINVQPFKPIERKKELLQDYVSRIGELMNVDESEEDELGLKEVGEELRGEDREFSTFIWKLLSSRQQTRMRKYL